MMRPATGWWRVVMRALRSVTVTNVRVRLHPGNGVTIAETLNAFPITQEDDGAIRVDVGALYSGETQHIVVRLDMPAMKKPMPRDTALLHATATGIGHDGVPVEQTAKAACQYVPKKQATDALDPTVEEQRCRLVAGRAIAEAHRRASKGDYEGAERICTKFITMAKAVGTDLTAQLVALMQRIAADVGDPQRFAQQSAHVGSASTSTILGRATGSDYTGDYTTSNSQRRSRAAMGAKPAGVQQGSANMPSASQASSGKRSGRTSDILGR